MVECWLWREQWTIKWHLRESFAIIIVKLLWRLTLLWPLKLSTLTPARRRLTLHVARWQCFPCLPAASLLSFSLARFIGGLRLLSSYYSWNLLHCCMLYYKGASVPVLNSSREVVTPVSKEGEWSVSFRFLPLCYGEGASGTHWIAVWLKTPSPGLGCSPVIHSVPRHLFSFIPIFEWYSSFNLLKPTCYVMHQQV
jgi:hypothetical protein